MLDVAFAVDPAAMVEVVGPLQSSDDDSIIPVIVFFLIGLLIIYDGFNTWQQKRLMQDTPTEKVRSAAVGRTELSGTGEPIGEPLDRPFTDGECLVATYEIEEWEEDDDHDDHDDHGGHGGHWSTVESGARVAPFELDDGTGRMRVEPEADATFEIEGHRTRIHVGSNEQEPEEIAEFLSAHTNQEVPASDGLTGMVFGERRRYTERVIPPGEDLYLLGGAEPRENASGVDSDRLVLGRDEASEEFIISNQSEAELVSEYKWRAPAEIVVGLLLSAAMLYFLLAEMGVA